MEQQRILSNMIPDLMETASVTSEDSAAIVSLFNSWSTSDCGISLGQGDDDGLESVVVDDRLATLPVASMEPKELLENLKKRCRQEDLPPVPKLRPRKQPTCRFLNYMGANRPASIPESTKFPSVSVELEFDLGLEENDALYPVCSKKARHQSDQDEASDGLVTASQSDGLVRASQSDGQLPFGSREDLELWVESDTLPL